MKEGTNIIEIALFLCVLSLCVTVAFSALHYTRKDLQRMQENTKDVRQIQQVDTGGKQYPYMNRSGAYLDINQLLFSAGTASADRRVKMNIFGREIQAYDMYIMNVNSASAIVKSLYTSLENWWFGFVSSSEYRCSCVGGCLGADQCFDAQEKTYTEMKNVRTFAPSHITPDVVGYEMANPIRLSEAKFKFRVVEVGTDEVSKEAILEYRVFIFLGSLVKSEESAKPRIEYRWYECVIGDADHPWVVLE